MDMKGDQAHRDFLAIISSMIAAAKPPVGIEGVVSSGSYSPATSDATSIRGDTYAAIDAPQPIVHPKISIATAAVGDQWGPMGDERCILIPTQSGFIMLFEHGEDDSPGAPAGWRYINVVNGIRLKTTGGLAFQMDDPTGYAQVGGTGLDATLDAAATVRYVHQYVDNVFNAHVHSGVQGGIGTTGTPTTSMNFHGSAKVKIAQ